MKGGKADAELRKIQYLKRLRAPVQVPLFTSPLEADPTGNGKVGRRLMCYCAGPPF